MFAHSEISEECIIVLENVYNALSVRWKKITVNKTTELPGRPTAYLRGYTPASKIPAPSPQLPHRIKHCLNIVESLDSVHGVWGGGGITGPDWHIRLD